MEKLILKIEDLDMFGFGIAHLDGNTYFVENAIVGEEVEAEVISFKKNLFKAKTSKILSRSKLRTEPKCPYFNECGGCDIQHITYLKTLDFKKDQIVLLLKKIAGIEYKKDNIEIVRSDCSYYYRNKIAMQIKEENGISKLCYYKKHSHDCVFVDNCYICDEKFKIVITLVNNFLKEKNVKSFDSKTNLGYAKHLVARIIDDKLLLTFVSTKKDFPVVETLYQNLKNYFTEVGISLNINKSDKDILSNEFIHLRGISYIKFETLNIQQVITNASFLQVNSNVQDKLYQYVLDKANGIIVNAYSGAGLLTCMLSKNIKNKIAKMKEQENLLRQKTLIRSALKNNKVIGIEINKEATKLADTLIKANKMYNIQNICGDASKVLSELHLEDYMLVLDPPRSGIDDKMIETIINQKPNSIVYISCSLNSLCKNLKQLKLEYEIDEIKGFDMFPQTKNLETVVVLKRRA